MKLYCRWCSMSHVGLLWGISILFFIGIHFHSLADPASPSTNLPNALSLVRQLNDTFASVAERSMPWVVVINVATRNPSTLSETDLTHPPGDPANSNSLPDTRRSPTPSSKEKEAGTSTHSNPPPVPFYDSQGSGVIWTEDGFIVTNGHVIEDANDIQVRLADGREFPAKVHARDLASDIAVLKIQLPAGTTRITLPRAVLGDSSRVRPGEFAIAIGAPFDLDYSVTIGHISAKGRSNVLEDRAMDQDFIQTDAQINPGNSGGPLLNLEGELIGINTLIRGLHTGIGFAIPANQVRMVADELVRHGKYGRTWLGIGVRSLKENPILRAAFPDATHGLVVKSIEPRGPAVRSELKPGDLIVSVEGRAVMTANDLKQQLRQKNAGDWVQLELKRNDKRIQLKLQTESMPEQPVASIRSARPWWEDSDGNAHDIGVTVRPLTAEAAEREGAPRDKGVQVVGVQPGSIAEQYGLRVGVVITELNRKSISSTRQFREAIASMDLRRGATLQFYSEGAARFEFLRLENP